MKKVIIPFNGGEFSESAFSFAIALNETKRILLTGIFLSQVDFSKFFLVPQSLSDASLLLEKDGEEENIRKNIELFTALCEKHNIEFKIHQDLYDFALPELTKESRFADLLIIGSEMFIKCISENEYNIFLMATLQHTECPVMVVPEYFHFPSENILAYDGSTSSVFAIKQFAYLFPDLCNNKTILAYAGDDTADIPAEGNIEELAQTHFSNLAITILNSGHRRQLVEWILKHDDSVLITGSFGRPGLSSQFTKSFVTEVIDAHLIPVFIAHQ
jgi:hypothetical protein